MSIKKLTILITTGLIIVGSTFFIKSIFAQNETAKANIQYPVAELGGCTSEASCKKYCDESENIESCINFAQNNGLMTKEEIAVAKKFTSIDNSQKPGKCTTKASCEEYCNDISHIDECLAFAEKNNILPKEELAEAKKVQTAIAKGIKPPACGNKKDCDTYCDSPEHMEECMTFALEAGFMSEQEKADSQKMLAAIKRGVKPPPCKGKKACDVYCQEPNNMEICMNFAMEAGFMSEEEKANSQKMLAAVKKGAVPPKCKGKECDVYCQEESHFEECLKFAEAAGFMNPEEAAMSRKTGGKGPGGCKGKEECDAFCNNQDNQETCFNFGKENGMIPEKDLQRMEEGKQQFKQSLSQAPQAVLDCLNSQVGSDMLEKMKSGSGMPSKDIGDKMQVCFQQEMGQPKPGKPGEGGMIPPAGRTGPGGCKTQEECQSYCEKNPQECQNFKGPNGPQDQNGQQGPGPQEPGMQQGPSGPNGMQGPNRQTIQTGPGGCKSPEECSGYCQKNPQECQNFKGPQQGPGPNRQQSPAQGPEGGMGISNEQLEQIAGTQPPCNSPEECQKMPPQNMTPPVPCQGENCNYGPPPGGTIPEGQAPQQYQQPIVPIPGGETGGTIPAGTDQPIIQTPQTAPNEQMAPQIQMEPQPIQTAPTSPPPSEPAPAPGGETPPPPPTSLNNPNLFLGFILSTLDPLTRPFLYGK
ncbi:MAG: hypothetical protein Q7R99_02795 [bacterium]|nr:hypothetical protein [bacterium]